MENKPQSQSPFLRYFFIFIICLLLFTCGTRKKVGAVCNDGTSSHSTGSGTCSWHDGVNHWKYEYWWD